MPDFIDLIRIGSVVPGYLKSVAADKEKIAKWQLTSAQLELIKTMEPNEIRLVIDVIEKRLETMPRCNACMGGSHACIG